MLFVFWQGVGNLLNLDHLSNENGGDCLFVYTAYIRVK
jgi:hypothetical protein